MVLAIGRDSDKLLAIFTEGAMGSGVASHSVLGKAPFALEVLREKTTHESKPKDIII